MGTNNFEPVEAIAPGETIKENMEYLGLNQKKLAIRLGITEKHLSGLINGKVAITASMAIKLEEVLGPRAKFWMNLEANYRLDLERIKKQEDIDKELEILKNIKYTDFVKNGWLKKTRDKFEKIEECRKHYGVSNLCLIDQTCNVRFRKNKTEMNYNVAGWLAQLNRLGNSFRTEKFSKTKLKTKIQKFRELTNKPGFFKELVEECAMCGIALIILEDIPGNGISGATIWAKDKIILGLTVRGKKSDKFWFTFFHELAHILHHEKEDCNISYDKEDDEIEAEADRIARNYLIPDELYSKFLERYSCTKTSIVEYSRELNIHPSILLGRLTYDGYLAYGKFTELQTTFRIVKVNNN
ncbi:HigA family addiction module antitoxin [uncultured Clostridium sp.]|uniref:HigA family addiction module antitoxin n=1 Tax=uncultured Clostridium sp. TaxID=59620 RepID=UPI0026073E75|nr:HigA family addiction module antitoxin [uncultured Clostridium sp.]